MFEILLYLIPTALQVMAAWGFYVGGHWVYLAIASFPVLMLIDSVLPRDMSKRKMRNGFLATVPLYLNLICGFGLIFVLAWRIGQDTMTFWETFGAVAGLTWMSVVPMVPASHELYHRRNPISRFLGVVGQIAYFDISRDISHIVGHHVDVATPADSDTAVRGENLYSFTVGALARSTMTSIRVECEALERKGKGRWSLGHRFYKAIAMLVLIQIPVFLLGGWPAVGLIVLSMFIARCWIESFNYFQHYGLVRVPGAPISNRHSWSHLHPISRILNWEITNHVDHHLDPYKPYYELVPDMKCVRLPSIFVCFVSALVPPVWHRLVIMPALKDWDLNLATPEEQKLAREANRRAGWPNWLDESPAVRTAAAH